MNIFKNIWNWLTGADLKEVVTQQIEPEEVKPAKKPRGRPKKAGSTTAKKPRTRKSTEK